VPGVWTNWSNDPVGDGLVVVRPRLAWLVWLVCCCWQRVARSSLDDWGFRIVWLPWIEFDQWWGLWPRRQTWRCLLRSWWVSLAVVEFPLWNGRRCQPVMLVVIRSPRSRVSGFGGLLHNWRPFDPRRSQWSRCRPTRRPCMIIDHQSGWSHSPVEEVCGRVLVAW
jgi:hypothetical protein